MNTQDLFDHELSRFKTYRLLANAYYLPDQNLLDGLTKLGKCMEQICGKAGKYVKKIQADIGQKKGAGYLNVDYAKLFVGPFNLLAPPYGSVYLEGKSQVMGNSTIDVKKRYAEEGLDIGLKEAPDHIAIELEFLYFLVFQEIAAFNDNDFNNMNLYQSKQKSFLETHLGVWVTDFTNNIAENTETVFYKNLARLTDSFVIEDLKYLSNIPQLTIQGTLLA